MFFHTVYAPPGVTDHQGREKKRGGCQSDAARVIRLLSLTQFWQMSVYLFGNIIT